MFLGCSGHVLGMLWRCSGHLLGEIWDDQEENKEKNKYNFSGGWPGASIRTSPAVSACTGTRIYVARREFVCPLRVYMGIRHQDADDHGRQDPDAHGHQDADAHGQKHPDAHGLRDADALGHQDPYAHGASGSVCPWASRS